MKEITKEEFKKRYFEHPDPAISLKDFQDYWDKFYEPETNATYFYSEPEDAQHSRMTIVTDFADKNKPAHRMFFRTEQEEEISYEIGRDEKARD